MADDERKVVDERRSSDESRVTVRSLGIVYYLVKYISGRVPCRALCSCDHQPIDQLWFLDGLNIPVILRPMPNNHFQFIGAAYVAGYMYGKILQTEWAESRRQITLE